MRTEHSGAKNGGGYWGTRADAKTKSNKARRGVDKHSNIRRVIRRSDTVRLVPTFGSPAHMPRARAEAIVADDNALLDLLRSIGAGEGYRTAYIESR